MWLATSRLSNELRVQYGRDFQYEQAAAPLPQEPAVGPGGFAPEIAIGPNGFRFGSSPSLGRKAYPDENKIQLVDLVTWTRGRHQLQVGVDLSLVHDDIDALTNTQGAFHYDSSTTSGHAGGLVDWITDYTFNVNVESERRVSVDRFAGPRFLLSFLHPELRTAGGHVQYAGVGWVSAGHLARETWAHCERRIEIRVRIPCLCHSSQTLRWTRRSVRPARRAYSLKTETTLGHVLVSSWEPFGPGRGVVRIGYGLFYGRLPGATVRSALVDTALASTARHVLITPTTVTNCPQVANQGFGYVCAYLTTPPSAVTTTTSAMVFDRGFRLPAVQQGSFTVEREVGAGVIASATYLMNIDRQLPNSVDINIAPSTATKMFQLQGGTGAVGVRDGETFVVPVYTQRVNTSFGPVTDIVSNADATYNAMVLEARRRLRGGFEFRTSWTWAKAIDYGQGGATPRTNAQFDPFNVLYDKGLSALNYPHKILASAVWEPTLASDRRWFRMAANGWTIAPLFTESSGRPYSLDIFGGTRLAGGHESINGAGGAAYLPTVGRNTLRLPDTGRIDLRVSRALRVTERVRMRGSVEVFNLTNRVNYSAIMQRAYIVGTETNGVTPLIFQNAATVAAEGLNVRPFGTFTAASTGQSPERQVQLGVRVEF